MVSNSSKKIILLKILKKVSETMKEKIKKKEKE